jgi:hypothetical protein
MYLGLHIQCPDIFVRFSQFFLLSRRIFLKPPNTKFHGNPSNESRAETFGHMDGHGEGNTRFFATTRTCLKKRWHEG